MTKTRDELSLTTIIYYQPADMPAFAEWYDINGPRYRVYVIHYGRSMRTDYVTGKWPLLSALSSCTVNRTARHRVSACRVARVIGAHCTRQCLTVSTRRAAATSFYSPVSLPARSSGQVVLGTAVIKVINPKNNCTYLARAFLDGGSQSCFITTNLKEKLDTIDMLLGAELFYDLLCYNNIKLGPEKPMLVETKLGWVVAGRLYNTDLQPQRQVYCNFTKEISDQLAKFWSLEEVPTSKPTLSADNEFCERYFTATTKRLDDGRFSVFMPFKETPEVALGDSYSMAEKRFYSLEKKLNKDPHFKNEYCKFIREYEELGHLTEISRPQFGYFMPHHAVIRERSETTRLRVVFDSSAKSSSNKSLNSIQHVGPVVQDELFNILIRYRQHKYVLSGDIQKMYRQIMVDESQRHLQLILWREQDNMPLKTLQLNTVTYGTACAPYLSTRCLVQLAMECSDPVVSKVIKNDFYVDDLLTGAATEGELAHILKTVTEVLNSAGFPIHKFKTNCPQIFQEATESDSHNLSKESSVLGVLWAPSTDTLRFEINIDKNEHKVTKRMILSNTCKIFDPLGLLSPCTITLKILLQKLWELKLEWDSDVPNGIKKTWDKIINNLDLLLALSIPRSVLCSFPVSIDLHCFVDASQNAYAACVYLRSTDDEGNVSTNLLCAKTRVVPLKPVTIPRLELCAALLGARLATKVCEALRCKVDTKTFWSDSSITIGWIKTQPKLLKTFVCNRVNEIHELTERESWRHVPTDLNPADMASRGIEPSALVDSALWWNGPQFLSKPESEWPQQLTGHSESQLPEIKAHHVQNNDQIIVKFENFLILYGYSEH
ncbi:uncharacterized protein LOC133530514 [Cydia pomonella]|uniref:uncharacterized protein LOC133530514 n=1 Tax=Cydia pomonella TaxID=82600 RepID=UPI002ADDEC91|nr:uncharacterized protein LOC133530514 [Cydia pomonella]